MPSRNSTPSPAKWNGGPTVQIGQQNVQFRKDSFLSTDILPEEEITHESHHKDHSINFPSKYTHYSKSPILVH